MAKVTFSQLESQKWFFPARKCGSNIIYKGDSKEHGKLLFGYDDRDFK